jgi:hypothetical protein
MTDAEHRLQRHRRLCVARLQSRSDHLLTREPNILALGTRDHFPSTATKENVISLTLLRTSLAIPAGVEIGADCTCRRFGPPFNLADLAIGAGAVGVMFTLWMRRLTHTDKITLALSQLLSRMWCKTVLRQIEELERDDLTSSRGTTAFAV